MGIVVGGELHRGARGAAGEVGFLPLSGAGLGPSVQTTRGGALEEAAAASGLVRTARDLGMTGTITAERIFSSAASGNDLALQAINAEASRLAVVVAAVAAIIDPNLVILGGGIGSNAELLLPHLETAVEHLTPLRPPISLSTLGSDAILLGALSTALTTAHDLVFTERAGDGR
jgi:predicted NBD/HSP70 family sugar kinase